MKQLFLVLLLSLLCTHLSYCMQSDSRGFLELPQDVQKIIMLNAINNGLSLPNFARSCKAFQQYMSDDKFKRDVAYPLIYRMADMHKKQKIAHCLGIEDEQHYKTYIQNTNELIDLCCYSIKDLSVTELQQVKKLLLAGADCHAYSNSLEIIAVLISAAFLDKHKLLKMLTAHGANVNKKHGSSQITALIRASQSPFVRNYNYNKTVKILLRAGADINAQDAEGNTALMYIAQKSNVNAVKMLIKAGADITLRNLLGKTAYDMACEQSRSRDICELVNTYEDSYKLNQGKYSCTIV